MNLTLIPEIIEIEYPSMFNHVYANNEFESNDEEDEGNVKLIHTKKISVVSY